MKRSDFEIMAPVGSRESLAAAIKAGANSIYFGIGKLNMRSHSANAFTIDDLKEIAAICHEHGVQSYLTVNTIIYGEDIPTMHEIIDAAVVPFAVEAEPVVIRVSGHGGPAGAFLRQHDAAGQCAVHRGDCLRCGRDDLLS